MRLAGFVEPDAALGARVERHEFPGRGSLDKEDRRGTGFALLGLNRGRPLGDGLGHLGSGSLMRSNTSGSML